MIGGAPIGGAPIGGDNFFQYGDGGSGALQPNGLSVSPSLGAPALGQTHELVADGISSVPTLGEPAVSDGSVTGTITVTDGFTSNRVYQRDPGLLTRSFTISGTYTGGPPTAIEYRTVRASDSSPLSSWATLDAVPSGGTFSGTVAVPASAFMMHVECRFANGPAVTDETSNAFGIGVVWGLCGQSNAWYFANSGSENVVGNDGVRWAASGWADVDGFNNDGITALANAINDETGLAVGIVYHAVTSTGLVAGGDTGNGYWNNFGSNPYATFETYVNGRTGGDLEGVIFVQGENDAAQSVAEATYQTGLETFVAELRADFDNHSGRDTLPLIIAEIGTHTTLADAQQQAIRNAQKAAAAADADVLLSGSNSDLPLRDSVHYTNAAIYQDLAPRLGKVAAAVTNDTSTALWPTFVGWERSGTTVTVTLQHATGTDFTPTSGIAGFEFLDGETPITITAAVRTDATTITLTLDSAPSGAEALRYGYGADVVAPNAVVDDEGWALETSTEIDEIVVIDLQADDLTAGTPTLGEPALAQVHALTAVPLSAQAPALGQPTLGQVHALTATGLSAGTPTLGEPVITIGAVVLYADDLEIQVPTLGTPQLGQTHALLAVGLLAGTPLLGTPALDGAQAGIGALYAEARIVPSLRAGVRL